ncbi:MAG: IclR family transcriptional regulator [Halobacteriales archaeon]
MGTPRTHETTETSLEVLEAVTEIDGGTLSELSDHTGLATSTLHTHLRTLVEAEYVVRAGREYRPGLKQFHLGERARHRDERYALAKEAAAELAAQVEEEVNFAVEEHGRTIILFGATASSPGDGLQAGRYFHTHSSASGKAVLAEYSEERVRDIIDRWGMPGLTDRTITDYDELLAELETVREQGYAVNDQEELEGLRAVAIAVNNPDGSVFGTLDISGAPYRLPDVEEVAARLRPVVADLEADLRSAASE